MDVAVGLGVVGKGEVRRARSGGSSSGDGGEAVVVDGQEAHRPTEWPWRGLGTAVSCEPGRQLPRLSFWMLGANGQKGRDKTTVRHWGRRAEVIGHK